MSFAPQQFTPPPRQKRQKSNVSPISQGRKTKSAVDYSHKVEPLPKRSSLPLWLRSLAIMQQSSTVMTFLLALVTLAVYSAAVYSQKQWSQEYRQLEKLQRHERQLTSANEMLKNKAAKDAERPDSGLVAPDPANPIFIHPAPPRPLLSNPAPSSNINSPKIPISY
jgi:hypothetical protein